MWSDQELQGNILLAVSKPFFEIFRQKWKHTMNWKHVSHRAEWTWCCHSINLKFCRGDSDNEHLAVLTCKEANFSQVLAIRCYNMSNLVVGYYVREEWAPKQNCVCCWKVFQDVTLNWGFIDASALLRGVILQMGVKQLLIQVSQWFWRNKAYCCSGLFHSFCLYSILVLYVTP